MPIEKTFLTLSVHDIVDFLLRKGDIDNRVYNQETMLLGTKIHAAFQKKQGNDYLSEVSLKETFERPLGTISLYGRADGIIVGGPFPIIDEIKSSVLDLDVFYEQQKEWHEAQALCYALMYAHENGYEKMGVRLTYISQIDNSKKIHEKTYKTEEIETYIAFTYFLKEKCDVSIIECGMGGLIDATNVFTPILSIITSVSLEHTQYLGRSVSEIASNKAGIIKYLVPTLVGKLDDSAMLAIREKTKSEKSQLFIVDDYHNENVGEKFITFDYRPYSNLKINTTAKYQLKNVSIAIEATKILNTLLPVNEENIRKAIQEKNLNGRFEYLRPNLIIDGAHNPEAIENLVKTLENVNKNIHIVFACFRDKNVDLMLNLLGTISTDITLTTFNHKRARKMDDYFLYLEDYKFDENYINVINSLLNEYPDDLILVTGSLCFVGKVRSEIVK